MAALALTALVHLATARPDVDSNRLDAEEPREASSSSSPDDAWSPLLDAMRLYAACGGLGVRGAGACLKVRLVAEMDRAARGLVGDVDVLDGVTFVRDGGVPAGGWWPAAPLAGEEELEAVLPRALGDREEVLDDMILDRVVGFFRSHSLQLRMAALEDVQGNLVGEGRKKGGGGGGGKKGGLGLLLLPMMALGSLVPLAFSALFLLAGKALLVSKIALLLAAILGLKKLFGQQDGGHGHESTVVVSGHEHHGRTFDGGVPEVDPHRLAYRGQLPASPSDGL